MFNTTSDALDHILCNLNNYAMLGTEAIVQIKMELKPPSCKVIDLSRGLSLVYQGLALVKGSPYSGLINHQ